ncbi:MAG: cytochrome c [Gallionellaceae bacterium]|nr:cytochrome c [Gallionellaceae bacterium]
MNRLVCCLLLAASGTAWSAGVSYTALDNRIAIEVAPRERNQILYEMRELLHGLHGIHHAMAQGDMKAVAKVARPMGETMNRFPDSVRDRLPEAFMQMGLAMHESFAELAKIAENKGDVRAAHEQIAEIMTYCSGCHDTYRFEQVAYKAGKRPRLEPVNPYTAK